MNIRSLSGIDMREATRLVRAGRLTDATDMIRRGLSRTRAPSDIDHPENPRSPRREAPPSVTPLALEAPRGAARPHRQSDGLTPPHAEEAGDPGLATQRSRSGARFEAHAVNNAAGRRSYKLYIPSGYVGAPVPLVVMLHGCTQSPDDFAAGTRMNVLAEELCFLVAYPEQTQAANASRCWNWFKPGDQGRDGGEPSLIADATRQIMADVRGRSETRIRRRPVRRRRGGDGHGV